MSRSVEALAPLFGVVRIEKQLVFSASFAQSNVMESSESEQLANLVWLKAVAAYYERSYPGQMVFSEATRLYEQQHHAKVHHMLENMAPDAKLIITAINERLSHPVSGDFNQSHSLLHSVIPGLLEEIIDAGPAFAAPVTSRWNSDRSCRLISCKPHVLTRFDPLALSYWVHAIIAATVRESGKRAYFHDALSCLEANEEAINLSHERRHQGCRYGSLAITYVADFLQQQSVAWLKQHAGLVNNMVTRLYADIR